MTYCVHRECTLNNTCKRFNLEFINSCAKENKPVLLYVDIPKHSDGKCEVYLERE